MYMFFCTCHVIIFNFLLRLGNILQISEFFITNYTMEEFLNANVIITFEVTLSVVYQQEGAAVTKIVNPLERGILIPPPPAKHGYVINNCVCICEGEVE